MKAYPKYKNSGIPWLGDVPEHWESLKLRTILVKNNKFYEKILDSITEEIVVIDLDGVIQYANRSWCEFEQKNKSSIVYNWNGVNYLKECDKSAQMGDEFGITAGNGIRSVIAGEKEIFYFEYPCHSPHEKRWFMMRVTPFAIDSSRYIVLSHQNITERKLAEEKAEGLARIDGLTNIPNRRAFDEFLNNELKRCQRLNKELSLAIIDIDHFKLFNDTYGHQAGDECLKQIGAVLKEFSNRPSDLAARYGGEEFSIVWGDTPLENSKSLANKLLERIISLQIPNEMAPTGKYVTASIGLATIKNASNFTKEGIIELADQLLYNAKESGRCNVVSKWY